MCPPSEIVIGADHESATYVPANRPFSGPPLAEDTGANATTNAAAAAHRLRSIVDDMDFLLLHDLFECRGWPRPPRSVPRGIRSTQVPCPFRGHRAGESAMT